MERILVLKLLTDTLNVGAVVDSVQESLRNQGYLNARVRVQEMYTVGDTVRIVLTVWKGFPYISRYVRTEGYLTSLMSYRAIASKQSGRILNIRSIQEELRKLDEMFGNRSTSDIRGDTLVIRNTTGPRFQGNIYVADSIRGSIEGKWDGLEIYYSERKALASILIGLPSRHPSALKFNYRRELHETYRVMIARPGISAGIKYRPASGMGFATDIHLEGFEGRLEYLDGWTVEGFLDTKFLKTGLYFSRTDTTFVGGAQDIHGYRENSLMAYKYLYLKVEIPVAGGIFLFVQPHWINRSRTIVSFGGGFESRNFRIFAAKAGGNPPTLHLIIRN